MRDEIARLLKQARVEFKLAGDLLATGPHHACVFHAQQSLELGLKALYMARTRKAHPKTHELGKLAAPLGAPAEFTSDLNGLTMDYATSRYPDAANGVPAELYTREMAQSRIAAAEKIWKWIDSQPDW